MNENLRINLANARYTGNHILNTGDLRQIGKTATLLEIAKEIEEGQNNIVVQMGVSPVLQVIYVCPAYNTAKRMEIGSGLTKTKFVGSRDLENSLIGLKNIVLLVDDSRYYQAELNSVLEKYKDRIVLHMGWY